MTQQKTHASRSGGARRAARLTVISMVAVLSLSGCALFDSLLHPEQAEQAAIDRSLRKVAEAAQQSRDYESATRQFERLHQKDPNDIGVVLGLARNLRYSGSPQRATMVLERALIRKPKQPQLLAELGRSLIAGGAAQPAIAPLSEALKIAPGNWRTLSALGIAHDQLGRHTNARTYYLQAQTISPENVTVLNNLALSWALSGNLAYAIDTLEHATTLSGATVQVRQNLALLHGVQGNDTRAYELALLDLPEAEARQNMRYYVSLRQGGQAASRPTAVSGEARYSVQIGAYATPARGMDAWRQLQGRHADLLSAYAAEIFDKKDGGAVPYVVWVGPLQDIKAAARLCTALRARDGDCLVVMQ